MDREKRKDQIDQFIFFPLSTNSETQFCLAPGTSRNCSIFSSTPPDLQRSITLSQRRNGMGR